MQPLTVPFLIDWMRRPITAWLKDAKQDKGGNIPRLDRELLLLLLARDAEAIIGKKPSDTPHGPFHNLCTWTFSACGVSVRGLEDAVRRCLKKYGKWLAWYQQPPPVGMVGQLSNADIGAIPEDPEPGLTR